MSLSNELGNYLKKLVAANSKWIKAVIVGVKPYGTKPHERPNSFVGELLNHYAEDLNLRRPLYNDLRGWRERGVLMLPSRTKETTGTVRRLANYNPSIIFLLFNSARVYAVYLRELGCDVRTEPPYFKRTDPVDWRL